MFHIQKGGRLFGLVCGVVLSIEMRRIGKLGYICVDYTLFEKMRMVVWSGNIWLYTFESYN